VGHGHPHSRPAQLARPDADCALCRKHPGKAKSTYSTTCTIHLSHEVCIKNPVKVSILFSHPSSRTRSRGRAQAVDSRPVGGGPTMGRRARAHLGQRAPVEGRSPAGGVLWRPGPARPWLSDGRQWCKASPGRGLLCSGAAHTQGGWRERCRLSSSGRKTWPWRTRAEQVHHRLGTEPTRLG
jgi:hypothetical protein